MGQKGAEMVASAGNWVEGLEPCWSWALLTHPGGGVFVISPSLLEHFRPATLMFASCTLL